MKLILQQARPFSSHLFFRTVNETQSDGKSKKNKNFRANFFHGSLKIIKLRGNIYLTKMKTYIASVYSQKDFDMARMRLVYIDKK